MSTEPSAGPTAGPNGTDDDRAQVAAVSLAWKAAYNARDVTAVADLYAEDARLSAPGLPLVDGREAITAYFVARIEAAGASDLTVEDAPLGDVVASGDLAWQWQSYRVVDPAGTTLVFGQLVTMFRRVDGVWKIAGDTWNTVTPA